ncbi:CC0125/CC1285 family lipoprotein [Hirschia baltica]|uniref:Lipoprotein n=1 Tax=Hirschia baltica (strain ATCC 49814 / DSM 5838 / IFAM 1418) TaxID=582402 RepID=C6XJZ2_HIRBI|nr:hypothetical protein [Hirschia baltica]ACT59437.1 conserved hypothetical protein [Hirschia baltica ATCC 49814]
MPRIITTCIFACVLVACASPSTVYAPMSKNGIGYQDQKIESNRFSVVFTGANDAPSLAVEKLALRRAAEITLENNHDWFRLVSKSTYQVGGRENNGTQIGVSAGGGSRGFSGVGVGIGFDLTPPSKSFESRLEIITGNELSPTDSEDLVYDARSILENSVQDIDESGR